MSVFGDEYRRYRRRVAMIMPFFGKSSRPARGGVANNGGCRNRSRPASFHLSLSSANVRPWTSRGQVVWPWRKLPPSRARRDPAAIEGDPRAHAALRQPPRDLAGGARAARQHHHLDREPAAGRGGVSAVHGRRAGHRPHLRGASRAGHSVRRRNVARRTRQCALRRRIDRFPRHEPRARGARRGSRLRRRAGRHAQAAQRVSARPGPVLSARSRRRCLARRHGGDALFRNQCGALRHHEGRGAGAEGGAAERRTDDHGDAAPRNRRPATTSPG